MNLNRTLAVLAVSAATVPALALAATPAFATANSPATLSSQESQETQETQDRPTYAELQKTAADADAAYETAAAAKKDGLEKVRATLDSLDNDDTNPLRAAYLAAEKAAKAASADRAEADRAVTEAEAKLAGASEDDKAAAEQELADARTAAQQAADAERDAKDALDKADTAVDDARVAATREYGVLTRAEKDAAERKKSAHDALAAAKECVRTDKLTVLADGLPQKVVAGGTTTLTLTVDNATDRTLTVAPLVLFHLADTPHDERYLDAEWSRDGSDWKELDFEQTSHPTTIESMKPGTTADLRLRLTFAKDTPASKAVGLLAGDASDAYNPCVLGPMKRYDFSVLTAGSDAGKPGEAEPGTVSDDDRPEPGSTPQGSTSDKPVTAGKGAEDTTGDLASTGTSGTTTTLALAGGAVVLGAGAVIVARRRRGATG
ncbi:MULTISPECIES: LPXTG cell wall anchor domain-containing protein [unclassified Streptomyces]|uniref:LPXTG cell wall anchor domain-containing protein n=1 Tax=unclassified Streptomyces TaxID=2593676 RepID=UPI000DBA6341|nr:MULTISPECIES: LPXTG cell wall anchor domain-containing protein [unclassified Streptomyces]MYT72229.1 LPXTG cell wall anchor domain-containing protein [Streptomyces sp. SID8367]RAJ81642.1 LPXTG-motif cell wall-anchored protein [Streptomyces sp. PsTaAH-137]